MNDGQQVANVHGLMSRPTAALPFQDCQQGSQAITHSTSAKPSICLTFRAIFAVLRALRRQRGWRLVCVKFFVSLHSQRALMTFDVSGGSHRKAVHLDAAQAVSTRIAFLRRVTWATAARTGITVGSWIGFLISAVSEYGFDVDFPLTPPLWLVTAICLTVIVTALYRPIGHSVKSHGERDLYSSHGVGFLADATGATIGGTTSARSRLTRLSCVGLFYGRAQSDGYDQSICRLNSAVTDDHVLTVCRDGIVAARAAIQPMVLLGPTVTRGPPGTGDQSPRPFERMPGCPARCCCTAPPSAEIHHHNSLSRPTVFQNRMDESLIRSAIEGEDNMKTRYLAGTLIAGSLFVAQA